IGMNLPASSPAGLGQQLKEELPIGVMSKDCFAPVTAAKHVIDRARILDAQRSGHLAKECSASSFVSILGSDPFLLLHQTLRVTPAMEAGIADHVWSIEEIIELVN